MKFVNHDEINDTIKKNFGILPNDSTPYRAQKGTGRRHLARLFNDLGYKIGAEIGVAKGVNSHRLCNRIPDLKLVCIDPWIELYNAPEGDYVKQITKEKAQARYEATKKLLILYNNVTIKRKTSMEAVSLYPNNYFDFVYIDGDHTFNGVMMDIICWSKKVRPGGIISGHDYFVFYNSGVIEAVNAYTAAHSISDWYVTHEPTPSWLWVKK